MGKQRLSTKQRAFIEHYLTCWNAAKAARLAGYSERTARSIGSENLTKPDIQVAIRERLNELKMQADEVLLGLADHARGSLADFVEINEAGHLGWNFTKAAAENKLKLMKKFKITRREGQNFTEVTEELELYDAQAALVHLGKHHRLFADKIEIDWKRELEQVGLDPEAVEQGLVEHLKQTLTGSPPADDDGDSGEGEGAT